MISRSPFEDQCPPGAASVPASIPAVALDRAPVSDSPEDLAAPLHPSDAEFIRRAQLGDAAAFEHLYRLHSRRVYALCFRMSGNALDAEELTQEAFMQVFRKIQTFRGDSAFTTWLHRLTFNVVLMRFRKKMPPTTSLEEITEPDEESRPAHRDIGAVDLRLAGTIDRMALQSAIDQLPPGYKSIFLLHDVEGYGHDEIAKILGCSLGNSKSQLHKARAKLRRLILSGRSRALKSKRKSRRPRRNRLAASRAIAAAQGLARTAARLRPAPAATPAPAALGA